MSSNSPPPDPDEARAAPDFVALLRSLKGWSGLTYRQMEKRAEDNGDFLPRSTISTALSRETLPREELVRALVMACGCDPDTVAAWLAVRRRLAAGPEATRFAGARPAADGRPSGDQVDEVASGDPPPPSAPRGGLRRRTVLAFAVPVAVVASVIAVVVAAVPGVHGRVFGPDASSRPSGSVPARVSASASAPAVRLAAPVAWWRFDEPTGPAADSSGRGFTATTHGGVKSAAVSGGRALEFDGSGHAATRGPVNRSDRAFTITAWARLDETGVWTTVVTQHEGRYPAFLLNYDPDHSEWAFLMPHPASGDITGDRGLFSGIPAVRGRWTHLAVVFAPATRQVNLYVDGALEASGPGAALRRGDGPLDIGRGWRDGRAVDGWRGGIDDVRVFDRALTGAQIHEVLARRA